MFRAAGDHSTSLVGATTIHDQTREAESSKKWARCDRWVTIRKDLFPRIPGIMPRALQAQPAEGARQVSLKATTNKEAEKYCWTNTDNRFCCIISPGDFFRLTGKKEGKGIITINGREYAVTPHNNLNNGDIICPSCYPELDTTPDSRSLLASGCQKRVREHENVVVKVCMPGETIDQPVQSDALEHGIETAMRNLPVDDNRKYQLQSIQYDKKENKYIWRECDFTVSLPHFRIEDKNEKQPRDDRPVVDVLSGKSIDIHLEPEDGNTKIERDNQILVPDSYNVRVKEIFRNEISLNYWQFRRLMPQLKSGEEALALVRKGRFYYYAAASYHGDYAKNDIEVNSVFQEMTHDKVVPVYQTLMPAVQCDIDLSWHRCFIHAHGLGQEVIEKQVRQVLKYVPMQEGKRFLVPVRNLEGKRLPARLEGVVTQVTGETGELTDVFQCHADTRLNLRASEQAILDGSNPQGRTEAEIVDKLGRGLWGIEDVLQQIARRVILPFGKEHAEIGILLYGPPGTGKSALSRNIGAALYALDDNVIFIKPAELMQKDPAYSAEQLEHWFMALRSFPEEPAVLVIDEIDTMLQPKKTSRESLVQQALRTTLQSLMDDGEQEERRNLVIIGTTNVSPENFDPALTRTNRFSVQLHMGLPDQEQRKEIVSSLFARQESPKITINDQQVQWLSRATENKSGADINHLVNEIVTNAKSSGDWNNGSVLQVTNEQIKSVLFPRDLALIHREKAMSLLQPAKPTSVLTRLEKDAIKECLTMLETVAADTGRKAIIQVKVEPGARDRRFFSELLKKAPINNVNYFSAVARGSDMIREAEQALSNASGHICSVIIIDRVDELIEQATSCKKLTSIGNQWVQFGGNTSVALVYTVDEVKVECDGKVSRLMDLPVPRKTITLSARVTRKEMEAILVEKYPKVPQEKIREVIKVFNADITRVGCFEDLMDCYSITDDEGEVCGWDIQGLRNEYTETMRLDKLAHVN